MRRWFAAHVVMYFKYHDGRQNEFPIYENVLLVQAADEDTALRRAEELGRLTEDSTCRVDGRPATLTFAGIRKIISCEFQDTPTDGQEATYSQFKVQDEESLRRFIAGDAVKVEYIE